MKSLINVWNLKKMGKEESEKKNEVFRKMQLNKITKKTAKKLNNEKTVACVKKEKKNNECSKRDCESK